ncbi:MAG: hypothetical protein HRU34_21115 [Richelia sp.]|nr:hypothetical protein [Richelia sp.]
MKSSRTYATPKHLLHTPRQNYDCLQKGQNSTSSQPLQVSTDIGFQHTGKIIIE